ncbi:MAG: hypothetical protein AAFX62_11100 [Pseudomonadota bacterium]
MDQALVSEAAYCAQMNWPRLRALVAQICALVGWASGPAPAQLPACLRLAALRLIRPAEAMARRLVLLEAGQMGGPRYIARLSPLASPSTAQRSEGPSLSCRARAIVGRFGAGPSDGQKPVEGDADRLISVRSDQGAARGGAPCLLISAHPGPDPESPATGRGLAASDPGLRREARKTLLPLTDTLPGFPGPCTPQRRIPDAEVPRVRLMEAGAAWTPPHSKGRDADRPVPAARTFARLVALQTLLDDPAPAARRMARWLARSAAMGALPPEHRRPARISPLRPGRPPGDRQRGGDWLFASGLSEVHRICAMALERAPPVSLPDERLTLPQAAS